MKNLKVCIIGLGLIGGSLARALKERLGITEITAVNRSQKSIDNALKDKTIKYGFTSLNEYVYSSDIIFICTPIKKTVEYIELLSGKIKNNCILTDVGSTKTEIIEYINSMENPPCFVGGHPMAGNEKTGYTSGFSHLFENAYYIITPSKSSTDYAIELMTKLTKAIGAIPIKLPADEHDKITAAISHVPHIIAAGLVNMVRDLDNSSSLMQLLAAGGFKDITRIASSSPEVWESIVTSNRAQVKVILECYMNYIDKIHKDVCSANANNIYDFFASAKKYRDTFPSHKKGAIHPDFSLIIDTIDKPGTIGEIATILGKNKISISNVNISHSREFEQGCLKITLYDHDSENLAYDLLKKEGYKVFKIN